jgi:hypothetical protein
MAATSTAAGRIGMAGQLGTLESGKLADLTILEKDPYAVDPDALMNINVSQTWVGGRKMFDSALFSCSVSDFKDSRGQKWIYRAPRSGAHSSLPISSSASKLSPR